MRNLKNYKNFVLFQTLLQTPIDSQRTQIFVTPPTEETPRKFTQMQNSKNYEFVSLFTTNGHPSSPTIESQLLPQAPNPPTVPALPPKISKSKSFNKLEANESEYIAMNNPNSNLPMNHKTKKYVPKLGISSSEIRETTYISMHNPLKGKSDNEIDKEGIYLDMSGKYRERTSSEPESYILKTKNIKAKY